MARTSVTAVVYVGLFAFANLVLRTRSVATQHVWMDWASTNIVNLEHHPVKAMVASAFVADTNVLDWVVLGLIGLVCAGHTLGNLRCATAVVVAHVLATMVSEGILAVRVAAGVVPATQRTILDIGPSYVIVAALVVGTAYGRWPARVGSATGFALLAPHLFVGLAHLDVSAVGHCCAIVTTLALGYPFRRSWRARTERSARAR